MKIEGDDLVFASGERCYAYSGVVGLGPTLEPMYGWDGDIEEFGQTLKPADAAELADYMIELWTKFKQLRGVPDGKDEELRPVE
jgi:hypothetical protein